MAFSRAIDKSKENSARRVIKQGHAYICGMCGTRYSSEAQAESCLKACIQGYLDQSAVQNKPEKAGTSYRCSYCKRIYGTVIQAKECARTCKEAIQKKIDAESRYKKTQTVEEKLQKLAAFAGGGHSLPPVRNPAAHREADPGAGASTGKHAAAGSQSKPVPDARQEAAARPARSLSENAPKTPVHPAEGSKFVSDGSIYRCHSCHQKYKKYQDAIACFDQHRDQPLPARAAKKDGDEKFLRDGAKYVCRKCKSKWLNRHEVISCYDGHKADDAVGASSLSGEASATTGMTTAPPKKPADAARMRRSTAQSEAEKFFRDGAKYVCRICNKKLFTKPEVMQCYDGHGAEDGGDASADSGPILTSPGVEAAAAGKAPAAKTRTNREGEDRFYRDGAKYVCRKCNSKHFTRAEVIQCFDKH